MALRKQWREAGGRDPRIQGRLGLIVAPRHAHLGLTLRSKTVENGGAFRRTQLQTALDSAERLQIPRIRVPYTPPFRRQQEIGHRWTATSSPCARKRTSACAPNRSTPSSSRSECCSATTRSEHRVPEHLHGRVIRFARVIRSSSSRRASRRGRRVVVAVPPHHHQDARSDLVARGRSGLHG